MMKTQNNNTLNFQHSKPACAPHDAHSYPQHWKCICAVSVAILLFEVGIVSLLSVGIVELPSWYRSLSQSYSTIASGLASVVPFSLWDVIALALLLVGGIGLVYVLIKRKSLLNWLSYGLLIIALISFITVCGWGLNHFNKSLSQDLNLNVETYNKEQLTEACLYYLDKASFFAQQLERKEDGTLQAQDLLEMAALAGKTSAHLSEIYPFLSANSYPVKILSLTGELLLYSGSNGIYMPFTAEANIPSNCATADIAFTMCHEAAHRSGIASEQEANFVAFLACISSSDVRFRYSAYYNAFCYCYSALCSYYPSSIEETFTEDIKIHAAFVFYDIYTTQMHYQQYDGLLEKVGQTVNDAYLKTFNEPSGVLSYGEVVDYLIAWYEQVLTERA